MALQSTRVSMQQYEQFIAQPENTDRLFELIHGEIVEKMPSQLHALIAHILNGFLFNYLRVNPIAWAFSEVRSRVPSDNDNSRIPDISVVLKAGRTFEGDEPLSHLPDIAIEIQSPDQSDKLMTDKAAYYLANGSRLVWLIYPKNKLGEVLTTDSRALLSIDDTLDGGDILPGFTLPVRELFPKVD